MRKGRQLPLWARILFLALLNAAVLAIVFVVFLRAQLEPELESFLMAESRERISNVTDMVVADLQGQPPAEWNNVFARYSKDYGITLLLYRNTGQQLAGPETPLPPEVDQRMPRGGPDARGRGGPRGRPEGESSGIRFEGRGGSAGRPPGPFPPRSGPADLFGPGAGPPFLVVAESAPRYWVGVRMPVLRDIEPDGRSVLMFVSPTFFLNSFLFDVRPWIGIAAGILVVCALCWLPLIRNLTHSITAMTAATADIAEGRFDVDLPSNRRDELGSLGASIRLMADRLRVFTEGRKRFLGDAAHELRSPIARMQLATEIIGRDIPPASQKYLEDLEADIATMSNLTDELLQFARADSMQGPVESAAVNVLDSVRWAVGREAPPGSDVSVDVDPALAVKANREFLVRALSNVIRNAVRYAGGSGPIRVSAEREGGRVRIDVSDSGPGVPKEHLDRIFTPFYRLDHARNRETGGTGLGLAIVRTCIEACGGAVECANREPSGLKVSITLMEA